MTTQAQQRKDIFEKVFLSHAWGNKNNAGVNYTRPYNKTKKSRGES